MPQEISWTFYGFVTPAGNRDVQDWFSESLENDQRDEVRDTLAYLQKLPANLWRRPEFGSLGDGLGEVRCKSGLLNTHVRIYAAFWPEGTRHACTLLLGALKPTTAQQKQAIKLARKRLVALRRGEASTHEFKFSAVPD